MTLRLNFKLRSKLIEKNSRLECSHIENSDSCDLIAGVRNGTPKTFVETFLAYLNLFELWLKIISILAMVFVFSHLTAAIILLCFIPVALISLRTGKQNYDAFVKFKAVSGKLNHYESVLSVKIASFVITGSFMQ